MDKVLATNYELTVNKFKTLSSSTVIFIWKICEELERRFHQDIKEDEETIPMHYIGAKATQRSLPGKGRRNTRKYMKLISDFTNLILL